MRVMRAAVGEKTPSFRARVFGSSVEAEWRTASHSLVSALVAHLGPDPAVVRDDERIDASMAAFRELADALESGRTVAG